MRVENEMLHLNPKKKKKSNRETDCFKTKCQCVDQFEREKPSN